MNGVCEAHRTEIRPVPGHADGEPLDHRRDRAVREEVDEALAAYRFNDAANALYAFVWGKVCDWYVEFAKPLLTGDDADQGRDPATMAWVIDQCLILLHPIMPFITEELWGELARAPRCWSMPTGPATAPS
jgi:valyl-tRNA synthetase